MNEKKFPKPTGVTGMAAHYEGEPVGVFDPDAAEALHNFLDKRNDEQGEPTYTLAEAERILLRRYCAETGHSWEVITDGAGAPVSIICGCGEAGNVVMK